MWCRIKGIHWWELKEHSPFIWVVGIGHQNKIERCGPLYKSMNIAITTVAVAPIGNSCSTGEH